MKRDGKGRIATVKALEKLTSTRSDEGLTLETSARQLSKPFKVEIQPFSIRLIKLNFH